MANDRSAQLAWAAGLFEGEGTFSTRFHVRDRGMIAKLKMTDEDVVRSFHNIVKVGNVTGPYLKTDRKPVWIWQVGSFEGVQAVMALLWNGLHSRRKQTIKNLLWLFHKQIRETKHDRYKRPIR